MQDRPPIGAYLCRDCLWNGPVPGGSRPRCPACGSPRGLVHDERDSLAIAHIDCDAFFAAVEKRENPELADRPVIIGGGRRGVVSTACYVARIYGVRSAMPMFKALEACPDAVVIRPRMALYAQVGRQVRDMMRALTPLVEPLSIDEAFLDLGGNRAPARGEPGPDPGAVCQKRRGGDRHQRLGRVVLQQVSRQDRLGSRQAARFLDHRARRGEGVFSPESRWVSCRVWAGWRRNGSPRAGIRRIGDIAARSLPDLMRIAGNDAQRLARLATGEDARRVEPERAAKSISSETTFDADIAGLDALEPDPSGNWPRRSPRGCARAALPGVPW